MPSTFFGIEIGRRALATSQVGQDVTGHNIANAGTDGYSVQQVSQQASDPFAPTSASPLLGSGVLPGTVTRARDQYLDVQVRNGLSEQTKQASLHDTLSQIESAYGEPSDTGLNHALGTFFQNFNALVNNPEDVGVRAAVVQGAVVLTNAFQGVQERLTSANQQVGDTINADVANINAYGQQIAALNLTIRQAKAQGQDANDLQDRRDVLIDKVAKLANVNIYTKPDGAVNVAIGTSDLVTGSDSYTLALNGPNSLSARGDLTGGALAGLVQAQTAVQGAQTDLNSLAASVQSQVNIVHKTGAGLDGSTSQDFFYSTPGSEASTIAVNASLVADPRRVAAAARPASGIPPPGDATVAAQIAALQNAVLTGGKSFQQFYQQSVSGAGGASAAAKTAADSAGANVSQLERQRASVSGVATDSELTNMLKYQRSYEAAAKVVKTMDDMISSLINDLGGR